MHTATIKPDTSKLSNLYSLPFQSVGTTKVSIHLEYMSADGYIEFFERFKTVVEKHGLESHLDELLYLVLIKNEQIRERYDAYWQNYEDDMTSKEVAKFLLAYKSSHSNQAFHLSAKPITGTTTINDSAIARWMAETIYNKIENRDFPLGLFGEKILFDLFGYDFMDGEPIALTRLEATANISPRKPTVRVRKLYVELCSYINVYLIDQTSLTCPPEISLTDAQANFFFDVLESIGYLDRLEIDSEPKDYVHSMFRNTRM